MHLPVFPPQQSFYFVSVFFWQRVLAFLQDMYSGKTYENMFEAAFPQFWGFRIAACFGVITACLGVNAACFPVHPKNWFLRGQHWKTGLILVVRAQSDMQQLASTCTCSRVQMHVGSKMGSIHSPNGWQRSSHHPSSRSQTSHIKSKVVWFSVTASFYQLRRVLDNAACSGKFRQNFSSIPLRPKFWQHEFIGIRLYQ